MDAFRGEGGDDAVLDREKQRLRAIGGGQRRAGNAGRQRFRDRPAEMRGEGGVGLVDAGAEGGTRGQCVPAHARPLRAVAAEHEGDAPAAGGRRRLARRRGSAPRAGPPSGERADELGAGSAADREPVRQEVAVAGRAAEQRRQGRDGRGGERGLPTRRQRVERGGGVRREQERWQRGPAFGFLISRGRSGRRGGGEQRGGVGAAEAEAVDADNRGAGAAPSRQGLRGGGHAQAERGEVDGGVGRLEVQRGRDAAMLQDEQGLEQPGHAGGGLRVADIRLRGADCERRAPVPANGLAEGRRFDRIARGGAGAVRLEIGDALRLDTSLGHRLAEQRGLRLAIGEGEAHRAAGGVGGGCEQHGAHRIAVLERVGERLQQDHAGAFGADIAIRRGIESAAAAGRREHPGAGKAEEGVGRQQ